MEQTPLLDVREAAALLKISPGSLYHWLSEDRGLPVVRLSPRCVRFRRSDLEEWISEKSARMNDIQSPAGSFQFTGNGKRRTANQRDSQRRDESPEKSGKVRRNLKLG
jgi:excisionase family DNA binding protein